MAFENFPTAENKPSMTTPPKKSDWRTFLSIGLVIALLGTWGYIIWDKSKSKEIIQQKDTQYASVITEKDTLQSLLDEATMRYDLLKTNNAKKDSSISTKDREIAEKRAEIQGLLSKKNASKSELMEAKRLIASLNTDIQGYKQQIEILKGQNVQLAQEKETVTQEKVVVEKNLESAQTSIKEKDNTIDVGSTLHASNFNIAGVNERKNGKEKQTTTAKRVDKLRITFDLDENLIAPTGTKDLYISITAPDGTPVAVEALGSGKFVMRDGQEKLYTHKVVINYTQGERQTVSFDWKQNTNFATGNYKIEVFNNGFKIGEGVRTFKKGGLFS
jgi:small-conductance mechanosensitive channel